MAEGRRHNAEILALLSALALSACATTPPGPPQIVKAASFPVDVHGQDLATNGSVFPATTSGSLYEPRKDWRVGDLVTIDIVTSATAADTDNATLKRAGTTNDTLTSFMGVPLNFGSVAGVPFSPTMNSNTNQQYTGNGSAAASNNVTGQVEAVITHVDPNGTLALAGRTNVNINGNVTSIVVTGYASPDDIAANTTISSNNVADMNVQYVGNGPIAGAHQVPWLQQALTKVWPF
jgi:flagellar L-ring protein precursor FlgH